MFRENGDSTSTPFLHLQGFDLQKDPKCLPWPLPVCPCPSHYLSQSLAGVPGPVNRQSFPIDPKCCRPRGCPSLSSERLPEAEGRCHPCRAGPGCSSLGVTSGCPSTAPAVTVAQIDTSPSGRLCHLLWVSPDPPESLQPPCASLASPILAPKATLGEAPAASPPADPLPHSPASRNNLPRS